MRCAAGPSAPVPHPERAHSERRSGACGESGPRTLTWLTNGATFKHTRAAGERRAKPAAVRKVPAQRRAGQHLKFALGEEARGGDFEVELAHAGYQQRPVRVLGVGTHLQKPQGEAHGEGPRAVREREREIDAHARGSRKHEP